MALHGCFRLGPVARRVLFLDAVKKTRTAWGLIEAIPGNAASIRVAKKLGERLERREVLNGTAVAIYGVRRRKEELR